MAERKEVIEFLNKQLEKLKTEEHVEDLMKAGRSEELEQIAEEIDVSLVRKFVEDNETSLGLSGEEIPRKFCYEIIIYLWVSDLDDDDLFEDYDEFQDILYEKDEEPATGIADLMNRKNICECSMEEICGMKH